MTWCHLFQSYNKWFRLEWHLFSKNISISVFFDGDLRIKRLLCLKFIWFNQFFVKFHFKLFFFLILSLSQLFYSPIIATSLEPRHRMIAPEGQIMTLQFRVSNHAGNSSLNYWRIKLSFKILMIPDLFETAWYLKI